MALQITFSAEDHLALVMGIGSNDVQLPQRTISRADFPGCPDEVVGQPVPILYGDLRESSAALEAPQLVANYTRGLVWAGAFEITDDGRRTGYRNHWWSGGWGEVPSGADSITNVTVADAAGGTIDTGVVVWVNRFYGMAVAYDATGRASTPYPAWTATVDAATQTGVTAVYDDYAADDRQIEITVTWPAAATTGWTCKVALFWNYYGLRADQWIQLTWPDTVATFTHFAQGYQDITPGATAATYSAPHGIYTVRAYSADGESPDSATTWAAQAFVKLPHYVEWAPVSGATGYRVYQWPSVAIGDWLTATGAPIRYWDVGNTTSWTGYPEGDGAIPVETVETPVRGLPVRHVGQLADVSGNLWEAFLVAGHACKSVTAAYLNSEPIPATDYGVTVAAPGQTDFATLFGTVYRDINSHRYTLIYLRGLTAQAVLVEGQTLTVDVTGIEDVGDGSGTLITDIYEQYEHLLRNWVPATALGREAYTSGAWQTSGPTWGDTPYDVDVIDGASFIAAKAIADARIAGGYTGAFGIGLDGFASVRDWVARLNLSADCYCGFSRKSQFVVKLLHATQALVDAAPSYTDTLGILRDTFRIEDDVLMIENQIRAQYDYNWADGFWRRGVTLEDVDAQTAVGETRPYELPLYATRNPTQAWDITNRRLTRRKFPYRLVSFESDMGALTIDLGDLVRISHLDGLGATGWTDRAGWVVRHEFDPSRFVVALDVLDVDYLINPVTEDMTWLPTLAWCADGGAFVIGTEDPGVLGSESVTVTEAPTATPA